MWAESARHLRSRDTTGVGGVSLSVEVGGNVGGVGLSTDVGGVVMWAESGSRFFKADGGEDGKFFFFFFF